MAIDNFIETCLQQGPVDGDGASPPALHIRDRPPTTTSGPVEVITVPEDEEEGGLKRSEKHEGPMPMTSMANSGGSQYRTNTSATTLSSVCGSSSSNVSERDRYGESNKERFLVDSNKDKYADSKDKFSESGDNKSGGGSGSSVGERQTLTDKKGSPPRTSDSASASTSTPGGDNQEGKSSERGKDGQRSATPGERASPFTSSRNNSVGSKDGSSGGSGSGSNSKIAPASGTNTNSGGSREESDKKGLPSLFRKSQESPKMVGLGVFAPGLLKLGESTARSSMFESKDSDDNSNDGDRVTAVRLKTIIDRVLDSSLGVCSEPMEPVPNDEKILMRIDRDEKERERVRERGESRPPTSTPSSSSSSTTTTTKCAMEGGGEREEEGKRGGGGEVSTDCKMAVCFMDHITKAVERSFSSITEEEERKEKEKVSADIESKQTGKTMQWGAAVMKALPVWNHWSFTWFLFPVVLSFSLLFFFHFLPFEFRIF
jgi:hypothetical protein